MPKAKGNRHTTKKRQASGKSATPRRAARRAPRTSASRRRTTARPNTRRDIDLHAHFFNLRYLPIAGLIRNRAGAFSPPLQALAWLLLRMTPDDRSLEARSRRLMLASDPKDQPALEATPTEALDAILDRVPAKLFKDPGYEAIMAGGGGPRARALGRPTKTALPPTASERRKALRAELTPLVHGSSMTSRAAIRHGHGGPGLGGLLQFLGNLMSRERTLLSRASKHQKEVGLFVHMMMDMETVFEDRPYYEYGRAIQRMAKLRQDAAKDGLCVLPFVAFDPYRPAAPDGPPSLALVREALQGHAFAGVKFYAPLGYRPSSNAQSEMDHRSAAQLDDLCRQLFDLCVELDVPIMAHCTPGGMALHAGRTGLNADPVYWRSILGNPRYARLRVCFAHAGGDLGWAAAPPPASGPDSGEVVPTPTPWGPSILNLCRQHEGVYTDLGHWTQVVDGAKGVKLVRDSLEWAVRPPHPVIGPHQVERKIIYGTDYPMPAPAGGWAHYHGKFKEIISDSSVLREHARHIFRENAMAFLNIPGYLVRVAGRLTKGETKCFSSFVGV